ncbi:MAG: hypothetical protein D5S00_08460, partial [Tindallia sp. MSAO_Bac2]
ISCFIPGIPHPIAVIYGNRGSSKSTTLKLIRKLIDPANQDLMMLPDDREDLDLTLSRNHAPCFDNITQLKAWQSDMLCTASTGGGASRRKRFTDSDEIIRSYQCCPLLNGINLVSDRDDFLDRSILFRLKRIEPEKRKEESLILKEFEEDYPKILGWIFETLSKAKHEYTQVELGELPRMADFCRWGVAIARAMGEDGDQFLKIYKDNIKIATEEAINSNPLGVALIKFINKCPQLEWEGTMTQLKKELDEISDIDRSSNWPKAPNVLKRNINSLISTLAELGVEIQEKHGKERITIIKASKEIPLD